MGQHVRISMDVNEHLESFAKAFMLRERVDRWTDLLGRRPKKLLVKSSDIYKHLDRRYVEEKDSLENIADDSVLGVYYDFINEPVIITFREAIVLGDYRDAIFSIRPGKLAIYFFHEGSNFVCRR